MKSKIEFQVIVTFCTFLCLSRTKDEKYFPGILENGNMVHNTVFCVSKSRKVQTTTALI